MSTICRSQASVDMRLDTLHRKMRKLGLAQRQD
jgi:hypothetical protein